MASLEEFLLALAARLRARRDELVAAIFAHVRETVAEPLLDGDVELVAGLGEVIAAVVDAGIESIERGQRWSEPVPQAAVEQARRAARSGVSLNTVFRRYLAGHEFFWDRVMEEADHSDVSDDQRVALLSRAWMAQMSFFDRLIDSISEQYMQESRRATWSSAQRRAELVQDLLAGRTIDARRLDYDLDALHIGVIATGAGAEDALRRFATRLDRRLLPIARGQETVWAWLGGRQEIPAPALERALRATAGADVALALGEPASDVAGFRRTHREAQAAFEIARRRGCGPGVTRYADVALVALALQDEDISNSFIEIYAKPLDDDGDDAKLRETLRAYFKVRA